MTLAELKTALEGVNDGAFQNKVAYRAFPVGSAPETPFICFMETESENFLADSQVYKKYTDVDIELYSDSKDVESEDAIESMLNSNKLVWDKLEEYIEDEDLIMVTYGITI